MIFYKSKKNRRVVDVVVVVVSASGGSVNKKVFLVKKNRLQKKRGRGRGGMKRIRLGSSFSLDRAQ